MLGAAITLPRLLLLVVINLLAVHAQCHSEASRQIRHRLLPLLLTIIVIIVIVIIIVEPWMPGQAITTTTTTATTTGIIGTIMRR
jgi:hypothetical protein